AATAGLMRRERWAGSDDVLVALDESTEPRDRGAAVWAAAYTSDGPRIVGAMGDPEPRVRLEAISSFARMKGEVDRGGEALIGCMRDQYVEVRREALRQAIRWSPPEDARQSFAETLATGLASGDREGRRRAGAGPAAAGA